MSKSKVFVITPFSDDFLALYEELKKVFEKDFDFTNAGDLDNQQNILQDIVEGINEADVIIADLTGLNANVFYELGLAHAMNKKVIIISQDIGELPFDIKSYRANEYSLQFNKLPLLIEKLRKLLNGAIDNTIKYGNPVLDYIPDFYEATGKPIESEKNIPSENKSSFDDTVDRDEEGGFLDCIADIDEYSEKMTNEINAISFEMNEMDSSIKQATSEIERVKVHSGSVDPSFARNICRKLSEPVDKFSKGLKNHVYEISKYWNIVENSYLILLDNQYAQNHQNVGKLEESITALEEVQNSISVSDKQIDDLIIVLQGSLGMERRLNKATTALITGLEEYLSMTGMIYSSIDRILAKGEVVLNNLKIDE